MASQGKKAGGQNTNNGKKSLNPPISPGQVGQNTNNLSNSAYIPPYTGMQFPFLTPFQIPGFPGFPSNPSAPNGAPIHSYDHDDSNVNPNETMFDLMRQMTNSIQSMDNRMKSIEQNIEKISKIEKNIAHLKIDVQKLTEENKSLSARISQTENSCSYISGISDNLLKSKHETEESMTQLKVNNQNLQSRIAELEEKNTNLELKHIDINNKYLDTQCDVLKNNLIVFGVSEARRNSDQDYNAPRVPPENPEATLRKTLKEKIQNNNDINNEAPINIDSIEFSQVKRIGDPMKAAESNRPRPLVVTFQSFRDRESVRKAGILLNKSQKQIKIHEHFPREIEDRRKKLYYPARKLSELDQKVVLVKDRLYINNKLFDPETFKYTDKLGNNKYLPKPSAPPYGADQSRYRQPPYNSSRQGIGYRQAKYNNYEENTHHYKPLTQNRKRADSSTLLDFTTPNRYQPLAEHERLEQKRKDCSPVDMEIACKRIDDTSSPNTKARLAYIGELEQNVPLVSLVNEEMMTDSTAEHLPIISTPAPPSDLL